MLLLPCAKLFAPIGKEGGASSDSERSSLLSASVETRDDSTTVEMAGESMSPSPVYGKNPWDPVIPKWMMLSPSASFEKGAYPMGDDATTVELSTPVYGENPWDPVIPQGLLKQPEDDQSEGWMPLSPSASFEKLDDSTMVEMAEEHSTPTTPIYGEKGIIDDEFAPGRRGWDPSLMMGETVSVSSQPVEMPSPLGLPAEIFPESPITMDILNFQPDIRQWLQGLYDGDYPKLQYDPVQRKYVPARW